MTIRILNSAAVALSTAVLLSACGGGGDSAGGRAEDPSTQSQGLVYAYPSDNQGEVSTAAPVILRFSASVSAGDAMNGIRLYEGGADGREMTPNVEAVQGEPNNVMIVPADDDPFQPNQQYTVVIDDLRLTNGDTARDRTLQFTTRALHEGPKQLVVTDMDDFNVIRTFPNFDNQTVADGERLAAMDFSSFRFQMSQPVDRGTAVYGESVTLTYGVDDEQVPATLLVDGRYLTVDPEPEHLDPSQNYTLTLTGDLASTYGANLTEQRFRFRPLDTSPRGEPTELVQRLTVGGRSKLTGRDVNQVPVNGTLLGEDANVTQARAESVIAELGDATQFPETLPIRLPKGTVLNGDEINPILIGGEVPAGFGSGDVTMTLLSDATGYLMQNPYSDGGESGARMIKLMMDVGIATGEARANGAFTQDLLHIELVGMANIDTDAGVLNVDAVSVVEPDILGQEFGYGLLSFQLQSYEDQNNAPRAAEDTTPPVLQSWTLDNDSDLVGNKSGIYRTGDAIVLNFDEVLDHNVDNISAILYENGVEQSGLSVSVDGTAIVIRPKNEISYNYENQEKSYRLQLSGVSDLFGNEWTGVVDDVFELPNYVQNATQTYDEDGPVNIETNALKHSPILLSSYPGFPCALDESSLDLSAGVQGRCEGSFPGVMTGGADDLIPQDDLLPLQALPANKPIVVQFSKIIDPESVQTTGAAPSFVVSEVDENGAALGRIPGSVRVTGKTIMFIPDNPWKEGSYYSYKIASNGDSSSSDAVCDGQGAVCGLADGLPIQTVVFADLNIGPYDSVSNNDKQIYFDATPKPYDAGGPDFRQYFVGGPDGTSVVQILKNTPSYDVNANFRHDNNREVGPEQMSPFLQYQPAYATYSYAENFQEPGAENQPEDPNADPALDPGGVLPPPNSAKVLSREMPNLTEPSAINGANFGCGYSDAQLLDPNNINAGVLITGALECPTQKFTFLNGALVAEVTNDVDPEMGIKVLIWPGQIMSSSVPIFTQFSAFPFAVEGASGAQILRMRYEEDEKGNRTRPITGWISDSSGSLMLSADVDLYMDGVDLDSYFPINNPSHNLYSKQISMELTGEVDFLDDGRLVIEQYNLNDVEVDVKLYGTNGSYQGDVPITIPAYGTNIQYVSESIK
ncbi:Ig-like domain-containing protein [Alloalcanivorax profundimaris]|uniref:Ig-like domain-containing protein n=1 Tax=Alloalcanivorax profundimaris TaxID=2735259 RepID=UPI0018894D84|nr:Ig-like domain-containing protein [Alloalcanivorax profundimaris]MBF1802574.1 hypothetical protein [Alloalcanivorax profundimaris]MCQ6263556.1 Ig-like domain-containing protein [Alcanivorax sp. MM125-6]